MKSANIHEAKTQLSQLVRRAERGELVVLCRDGDPVAHIVPASKVKDRTKPHPLASKVVDHDPDCLLGPVKDTEWNAKAWGMG